MPADPDGRMDEYHPERGEEREKGRGGYTSNLFASVIWQQMRIGKEMTRRSRGMIGRIDKQGRNERFAAFTIRIG